MDTTHPTPSGKSESANARLLLFSLADFWSLLAPLLTAAAPKTICEIGIGTCDFTRVLLDFCQRNNCDYCGIDPAAEPPAVSPEAMARATFIKRPSLEALADLPAQDVYFVDGDHNYYTVLNELRLIRNRAEHWPLIILHDVGWPWARRDHYCAPAAIPEPFRLPRTSKIETAPQTDGAGEGDASLHILNWLGGLGKNPGPDTRSAAMQEGGPRNGVLTAVEDFLAEKQSADWKLLVVPGVFGLGILCAPGKCPPRIADQFSQLQSSVTTLNGFLAMLERNRLNLLQSFLEETTALNTLHGEYDKLKHAYQQLDLHANTLRGQYDGLKQRFGGLHEQFESLHQKYADLAAHSESLAASYRSLLEHSQSLQAAYEALHNRLQPVPEKAP